MIDEKMIEAHAIADAKFAGMDFATLGRADKKRFLERAASCLSAALSVPAEAVVGEPDGRTPSGETVLGMPVKAYMEETEFGGKFATHWSTIPKRCNPVRLFAEDDVRSRISQQDAELERLRREVEEAKEFRAILEGHLAAAIDDYNDALKALEPFARVAEHDIGESEADSDFFMPMKTYNRAPLLTVGDFRNALALRAKAEETRT